MNVYDFDGTLYRGDSTFDFLLYSVRMHPSLLRFLPCQTWALGLFFLKRIHKTAMKEQIYRIFASYDAESLLAGFWDTHRRKLFPWYAQQQKDSDVVISASPEFLLMPICKQLGIRHLLASRVNIRTGEYEGANCSGVEKVVRFREAFGVARCQEFYSDSRSDQPMADIAENAFLVTNGIIRSWEKK